MRRRVRVEIRGAVQGVGFRPFVYRLAVRGGLTGWVRNDSRGVVLEAEGTPDDVADLLVALEKDRPPLSIIHSMSTQRIPPEGSTSFEIRDSEAHGLTEAVMLPDVATCPDCLEEIRHEQDRRRGYPFTNCTHCGPRFTIIESLPYDRPRTSMRRFTMCPRCRAEYDDPLDRRFHAQPNACPECGPRVELWDAGGTLLLDGAPALQGAGAALRAGMILAVKGLGGFHLMALASDAAAIARLRRQKHRRDKPLALMVADLRQARALCPVNDAAEALLRSPEAPIVLLPRSAQAPVCAEVAPGCAELGLMLPAMPLHHLLMGAAGVPLVATSGNLSDEPICTDEADAVRRLAGIADMFLVHDRPIVRHVDDSVVRIISGEPRILRRSRGYAPLPILLTEPVAPILAVGGHLKSCVALAVGRRVFLSQHIGDLESPEAHSAFERVIADFLRIYRARPAAIAHDLHPDYLATKWAQLATSPTGVGETTLTGVPLIGVQHHHAHLASCLADNGVKGPALGVAWDGTGFGPDGTIWGGEFLVGDAAGFTRVASLRPFRLLGAEAAVREPRRVALAVLWEMLGEAALGRQDLSPVRAFSPTQRRVIGRMLASGLNAPVTSSAGRLFDAVSSLMGLRQEATFEGQAAMAIENLPEPAGSRDRHAYPFPLVGAPASRGLAIGQLDWVPLIAALVEDVRRNLDPGLVACWFHNALVEGIVQVARAAGQRRVALTGGCFQNARLAARAASRLAEEGFEVLMHRQVPANDGGLSLGQVAVAAAKLGIRAGRSREEEEARCISSLAS